jgi:drug/metabolite transporter (DMT)-like permease
VSARAWTAFAIVSILWGIPYLLIKVAVDDGVSPAFLAWARCLVGAAVLLPYAWRVGALRGLRERWRWLVAFTVIEIVVPWPLLAAGEQRMASSLAAILVASVPLIVAVLAIRLDSSERATGARLAGLLVGFGGVVALLGIDVAGESRELVGAALILVVAVCYATGPMIIKLKLEGAHPAGTIAASLAFATLLLTPAAAFTAPESAPSTEAILSLVALGVLCSALAFVFFFMLIAEAGPGRGTIITYVNPVVAVALGVALLDEEIGAGAIVGLGLILAGSALATSGRPGGGRLTADAHPI